MAIPQKTAACSIWLSLLGAPILMMSAVAPAAETTEARASISIDLPAQALSSALLAFGDRYGLQFSVDMQLVSGRRAAALKGRFTAEEGLAALLQGSGLAFRFTSDITVVIQKATDAARVMGPVKVEGVEGGLSLGANGSTDVTATEGTGSYTSGLLTVAGKTSQSMKDSTQSVSVITQQRMQDQNITDFATAMSQATGITVLSSGTYGNTFVSRGFGVDSFQIDGGAPLTLSMGKEGMGANYNPIIDMAMYDHVEVLRGSDGVINGYGNPGGSINLVRKRPLRKGQVTLEGQVGSWNLVRTVIDATGPLGFDGRLRGRGVISYQDNDYFYDIASNNMTLTYGMLEFDASDTTTLRAGGSLSRLDGVPGSGGLPRYLRGGDLNLPRSTCLCFPWNQQHYETTEMFFQVDQALFEDWSMKLNLTRVEQDGKAKYGYVSGAVNEDTGTGPVYSGMLTSGGTRQNSLDVSFSGSFEIFGLRQQVVVGANYRKSGNVGTQSKNLTGTASEPIDILPFDPDAYPEPGETPTITNSPGFGQTDWGAFTSLDLTLLPRLHLRTGIRYSSYEFDYQFQSICEHVFYGCVPGEVTGTEVKTYQGHDFSWPPSYSLSYDLTPNISIYGSYNDVYASQADLLDHSLNPIGPQTGATMQAGVNWELADGRLNAMLAIYRARRTNFGMFLDAGPYAATNGMLPDGQRRCCYSNDADYTMLSEGADLEVTGEVLPRWQLSAGYTFNTNKYEGSRTGSNEGEPLMSLQPEHLLKLSTSYKFTGDDWLGRLSIGGSLQAQTKAYQSGSTCLEYIMYGSYLYCTNSVPYEFTQKPWAVGRIHLGYQLTSQWHLNLAVENIADKRYYQTMGTASHGNMYGAPRNYSLAVRGSF